MVCFKQFLHADWVVPSKGENCSFPSCWMVYSEKDSGPDRSWAPCQVLETFAPPRECPAPCRIRLNLQDGSSGLQRIFRATSCSACWPYFLMMDESAAAGAFARQFIAPRHSALLIFGLVKSNKIKEVQPQRSCPLEASVNGARVFPSRGRKAQLSAPVLDHPQHMHDQMVQNKWV